MHYTIQKAKLEQIQLDDEVLLIVDLPTVKAGAKGRVVEIQPQGFVVQWGAPVYPYYKVERENFTENQLFFFLFAGISAENHKIILDLITNYSS